MILTNYRRELFMGGGIIVSIRKARSAGIYLAEVFRLP